MDKEQFKALQPYKDLMRQTIINSAASSLPIEFRQTAEQVGKQLGITLSCNCSSGWFTMISKLYKEFIAVSTKYNNEPKEDAKLEDTKEKESRKAGDQKNSKSSKRKS